jgi:iron complex outermembrane receptor protein
MLGASRQTYNLGGYYEDDVFSARIAWSHRSASRVGLYGASDNYMAAAGTLALSVGYKISDSLSLNFEGLNLNNPTARFYNVANAAVPFDATSAVFSSGRQYYVGLRAKF